MELMGLGCELGIHSLSMIVRVFVFGVAGQKEGGQALLGGLHCTVHRNFFGSQVLISGYQTFFSPELSK
jgi:hypothetical protein